MKRSEDRDLLQLKSAAVESERVVVSSIDRTSGCRTTVLLVCLVLCCRNIELDVCDVQIAESAAQARFDTW